MENERLRKTVTLILKTKRFEVEKQKLINKSQYFAALLSANYLEYNQTEHIVNYDISPIVLQDFINWIHDDTLDTSATNSDLEEFDRLLTLLELSILFTAVDNLVEDVTDRLVRQYMLPKYTLNIWLLAQELNINTLRDLSLDVCLDRFNELPLSSIYELSRENFFKLIGNTNIKSRKSYVLDITYEWMNRNNDFTVSLDIIAKHKKAKILQSIISCEGSNNVKSENYIHCWDGNDFFELTSFNYPKDITDRSTGQNTLVGMQIIGRRYDLYLCGGEFGIGSNKFNKNVWRYSLISKKWYIQTVMPVERRDMVAVFWNNKLLLVGGMGKDRKRLQSVDIYDIYTDTWTAGATIPWKSYTCVPEHSMFNEKLIIYDSLYKHNCFFIYSLDEDVWKEFKLNNVLLQFIFVSKHMLMLALKTMSCYIDVVNSNEMVLRTVIENVTCNKNCNCLIIRRPVRIKGLVQDYLNSPSITSVIRTSDMEIAVLEVSESRETANRTVFMCMDCRSRYDTLHLRSISIQNPNKFRSFLSSNLPRKFFHLNHPADLHTTNLDDIKFV